MNDLRIEPHDWPDAVADADGPQIVVAGPGTGKTEFLVKRALHLLSERKVPADEIAILTFSRRAAADLRRRIATSLGSSGTIPASTFHSLAYRLLEHLAPQQSLPSLLTGPEQVSLVADLLRTEDETSWPVAFRPLLRSSSFADEVTDFILRAREHLLDDSELRTRATGRDDWRALPDFLIRYDEELRRRERIDYGTVLTEAVRLLAELPSGHPVGAFRYVLVDEYQDTTAAQAEMLRLLTDTHRNLTVAADPYQSVYSFRGAELHNVVEFPRTFRDRDGNPARRMLLTTSFRVPVEILDAAVAVTAGGELPGAAGPVDPAPHRGRVEVHQFQQQSEEAEWIGGEIQRLHVEGGVAYDQIAVLVRSKRRLLAELSRALERRGIPHDAPDSRLVDHPAVQMIFDCVQVATSTTEATAEIDRSMRRLLLGPLFALPIARERTAYRDRVQTRDPWPTVLRRLVPEASSLADLLEDPRWASGMSAAQGFWHLWTHLEQFRDLALSANRSSERAALTAFSQALVRQEERDPGLSLAAFSVLAENEDFEATPLLTYRRPGPQVALTTLHQAKGLEFEAVFIADASEGVFPDLRRQRSLLETRLLSKHQSHDPAEARRFRLQEEMRLAYTAMTRARSRVVWTATNAGIDEIGRRPSRFLSRVASDEPTIPAPRLPVTPIEAEAFLRRQLADPTIAAGRRLASVHVLAGRPNPAVRPVDRFSFFRRRGLDRGLIDAELRLSPSQAQAYDACPRRYALERRLNAGGDASPYMSFGSLIHAILEDAERAAAQRGEPHGTVDEAMASLDRHFDEYDLEGGSVRRAWRRRAEVLLTDLYENWIRPDAGVVLLEHPLSLEIDGVEWRGRADRIEATTDGGVRVVDYKTAKQPLTRAKAASSIQLGFYLVAARADETVRQFGSPEEAEFWYPLASSKQKWIPFDPDNADEVLDRMRTIAAGIRDERWEAVVSSECDRCAFRIVCPEWPEGREAYIR